MTEADNETAETGRVNAEVGRVDAEHGRTEVMSELIEDVRGLSGNVSKLTTEVRNFAHRNWKLLVAIIVLILVLAGVAVWNRQTLSIVDSATNPDGAIYRRGQAQQIQVVAALAVENDCRARRLAAGLPAPVPALKAGDKACPDQTPPEIYPGLGAPTAPERSR